jgi:hypothetical protein
MGMKIKVTNPDTYDYVDSDREYIQHEITTTEKTSDGYYNEAKMGVNRFYEDEETGIITRDVGKFEAWMRSVITR